MNSVITELSKMWVGLKLVNGKPRHQSQGSVEWANRGIVDMLTTWLQSNSITHWDDGLRFVQAMKRAYHKGIKYSQYEAMLCQPMKVGMNTSNLSHDAIEDMFTEKELEKVVSWKHGDKQNNLTEDLVEEIHEETPNETSNNLIDNANRRASIW